MSLRRLILLVVIVLLGWAFVARFRPRDTDRAYLLSLPRQMADLAETRHTPEILRYVAPDYRDPEGRTRREIETIVKLHVLSGGDITIYIVSPSVTIDAGKNPPHATLTFKAAMGRAPRQPGALDILPVEASLHGFTMELDKTSDGWLIRSADWRKAGARD